MEILILDLIFNAKRNLKKIIILYNLKIISLFINIFLKK